MSKFSLICLVLATILQVTVASRANAIPQELESCRTYTWEQRELLLMAYDMGKEHNWGYTLAAIVYKESFVGDYVARININDAPPGASKDKDPHLYAAFGITQIQLETAMDLYGIKSYWMARTTIATKLVTNDRVALHTAIMKLQRVYTKGMPWKTLVGLYNGRGPLARKYSKAISKIVNQLQACDIGFEHVTLDFDNNNNEELNYGLPTTE